MTDTTLPNTTEALAVAGRLDQPVMQHTPGPWRKAERLNGPWWHISAGHTVGGKPCKDGQQAIACVHGASKRGANAYAEMFEANANLIAAAPELLNALRCLLRHAERVNEVLAQECGVRFVDDGPLGMARDAVRKASGAA